MQKVLIASWMWLGVLAFAGCPSGSSEIEVRHSGGQVNGSSFQCTGTWPSAMTPCQYPWDSQAHTFASSASAGVVDLALARVPIPIDGGASTVTIELTVGAGGLLSATANEATSRPPTAGTVESSDATGGWVDPDAVSATPDARSAGSFSLTFPFGTIRGTYDTAPQP